MKSEKVRAISRPAEFRPAGSSEYAPAIFPFRIGAIGRRRRRRGIKYLSCRKIADSRATAKIARRDRLTDFRAALKSIRDKFDGYTRTSARKKKDSSSLCHFAFCSARVSRGYRDTLYSTCGASHPSVGCVGCGT